MSAEIIYDMSREAYDAMTDRANWSTLKHLQKSPQHYRAALQAPPKDTDARRLGRVRHLALIEPEKYATDVAVWEGDKRTKAWKEFQAANAGKEIITADEGEEIARLCEAIRRHSIASAYLEGARAEVTCLWRHAVEGFAGMSGFAVDCKARLDLLQTDVAIIDIKGTRDASPASFGRDSFNFGYFIQAAMYVDAVAACTGAVLPYVIVAAEHSAPYAVQPYRLPEALLERGRMEYRALLARLALCRRENQWGGYSDGELLLELPRWAYLESGGDLG